MKALCFKTSLFLLEVNYNMSSALSFVLDLINNPLSILFIIQLITIGLLLTMHKHNAERIDTLKLHSDEKLALAEKYAEDKFQLAQEFSSERFESVTGQLRTLRGENKALNTQYHLLDTHTIIMSNELETVTGKQLTSQGPNGDWRTRRPLNGG